MGCLPPSEVSLKSLKVITVFHACPLTRYQLVLYNTRNVVVSPHIHIHIRGLTPSPPPLFSYLMSPLWGMTGSVDMTHAPIPRFHHLTRPSPRPRGEKGGSGGMQRNRGRLMSSDPAQLCRASVLDFLGPVLLVPRLHGCLATASSDPGDSLDSRCSSDRAAPAVAAR